MLNNKISEADFLASLKRIERQYTGIDSSRYVGSLEAVRDRRIIRPPDGAGYALGKGLARSLLSVSSETASSSFSKECQEKTFDLLVNRDINPAVCQGFFDALLEPSDQGFQMNLDDFFTACILFADRKQYSRENDHLNDDKDFRSDAFLGPLTSMVRAYARYVCFKCEGDYSNDDSAIESISSSSSLPSGFETIGRIYTKLRTQTGRLMMIRELTDVAFVIPKHSHALRSNSCSYKVEYRILNPLLTCSTLLSRRDLTEGVDGSMIEAMLCMEGIWRWVDALIEDASKTEDKYSTCLLLVMDVIHWLTEMLNLYMLTLSSQKRQYRIVGKGLAHRWLSTALDIGLFVAQSLDDDDRREGQRRIIDWFEGIISRTLLSYFSLVPSYHVTSGPFWTSLHTLMENYAFHRPLSLASALQISTMVICHPYKEDRKEMLNLLSKAITTTQKLHPITISMIKGLGSIFASDPTFGATVEYLLKLLARTKPMSKRMLFSERCEFFVYSLEYFEDAHFIDTIMSSFFSCENNFFHFDNELSAIQQAELLLLFGIGLMDVSTVKQRKIAYVFLEKLLEAYPHLGISLLPVVVNTINDCALVGDVYRMMEQIKFLSEVIARDPQCAHEMWNILGKEFIRESVPVAIRSSIIRSFPVICQTNKRLYKRIIGAMANVLLNSNINGTNNDFELRLAIAASTADLASGNLIRDPTDVISWLQGFISDTGWVRSVPTIHQNQTNYEKEAIAYYSILALRSLLEAGELDFKLVVVVLRKKLCDIHNVDEVSRLPHLVLESLILLLGTGEMKEDSSQDAEDRLKVHGVSPQTSRSVESLFRLWNHKCLQPEMFQDPAIKATIIRCKRNILVSLTNYSFEALGVDEESVQSVCTAEISEIEDIPRNCLPNEARYNALKLIINDGIEISNILENDEVESLHEIHANLDEEIRLDFSGSLIILLRKILKFEEETLGSSLWQKRQSTISNARSTKTTRKRKMKRPNLSKQFTSPKSILDDYYDNRNQATALAVLLSFEGEPLFILPELVIIVTSNPSDTVLQILHMQSWLNAARSILRAMVTTASITESLDKFFNRMQDCKLDYPDSTFMLLSAIATLIPSVLGSYGDFTIYTNDLCNDIWEAYNDRLFEDSDAAKFCLGLSGACNLCLGSTNRVIEIVECLENSTIGYGDSPSFGAYYALAVIAQNCANFGETKVVESLNNQGMIELRERIIIFLIDQLAKCIKGSQWVTNIFISFIKDGCIHPEDIDEFTALEQEFLKVKKSNKKNAKNVFIALGICLPGIATANEKVLPQIISFLETFEWGSGVGFCLHPILYAWCHSSTTNAEEIEKKLNIYSKRFEECDRQNLADHLGEILYAMSAIGSKPNRQSIDKIRMIKNEGTDEPMTLVLTVSSIAKIPCLGNAGCRFVSEFPCLIKEASYTDVSNVVQLLSETSDNIAIMMRGFLASMIKYNEWDDDDDFGIDIDPLVDGLSRTRLPEAHVGTGLGILMSCLRTYLQHRDDLNIAKVLQCLEVIALPNQFSTLVEDLLEGGEVLKAACVKLLVSQIKGNPRAVFDGRNFAKLALEICKMSTVAIRKQIGDKEASEIFVGSFEIMLSKFTSQDVEKVVKNLFQFCTDQFDQNHALTITFLQAIRRTLQHAKEDKVPRFSPKCLKSLHVFFDQNLFLAFLGAISSDEKCKTPNLITEIIEAYADCIALIPGNSSLENKPFTNTSIDFSGECMYIRLLMCLIRKHPNSLSTHSYRQITLSIAWMSKQLISCNEGVFSSIFLQVACTVTGAGSRETEERKIEILISFLDKILMVDSTAGFVCVEILAAFVYQFFYGNRSDGDSSMLRALWPSIEKWVDLPPQNLKKTFHLAIHDLSFNLAGFARRNDISGVVLNRLSRIYGKWLEQGSDETTLSALRLSILCCRDNNTATNIDDDIALITTIVSKSY